MFKKVVFVILVGICFSTAKKDETVSDKDYGSIPPLFQFDNYDDCMLLEEDALFCTFTFKLEPLYTEKNKIWNIIENITSDSRNYRRDWLRHGICVSTKCPNNSHTPEEESIRDEIESCYNERYKILGLRGNLSELLCHTNQMQFSIDIYDIIVGIIFITYIIFVVSMSIIHTIIKKRETPSTTKGRVIAAFSLSNNWHRLTAPNKTVHARKLRSIQGIRFYNMLCVILCHTIMVSFAGPVENPSYIENITRDPLNMFIANGQFAVQTFFVISGMLLSFHFFQMLEERNNISMKYVLWALINRYIRLTPTLAVILAFESTWVVHMGKGPQWNALVVQEYKNCRKNWWTNILYINNYVDEKNMCLHQTWYLAADTQLFIFSILLLKITSKFLRDQVILVFGIIITGSILLQGAIAFVNKYDILMRQYPEVLYNMNMLKVDAWHELYSTGHSNVTGYVIGLTTGYLFYKYGNSKLLFKKIHVILWWIFTFGLCIFIILIAGIMYEPDFKYTRLQSALYWAFGKNLFALGVAIGIFGFTQKIGWFARWVVEWKAVQVFGRITYSTYIIHVTLIRIRAGLLRYPMFINDYVIINTTLGDMVLSYIGGTLLCLFVEMPISALQKLMIPQTSVKRSEKLPEETTTYRDCNGENHTKEMCTTI